MPNKIDYYCWASDFKNTTGEGNLARLYTSKILKKKTFTIITPDNLSKRFFFLNYKYISPFVGISVCWFLFINNRKAIYINYLPLWNFFIFLLLPPKTLLGPITGGAYYKKQSASTIIRKYLFPLLYKISLFFLKYRKTKLIFSTSLLKKYIPKNFNLKIKFNFIFSLVKKNNKVKKKIDFLIYYRKHSNKIDFFPFKFIKQISDFGLRIHIVGDELDIPNVINHGYIAHKKIEKILSYTKYTVSSGENMYSLFNIDCINNNVKIVCDINEIQKVNFFRKNFIFIDFKKIDLKKLGLIKNKKLH